MASGDKRSEIPDDLSGVGLRVGLVSARWSPEIVERLQLGASEMLRSLGVRHCVELSVPGCYELPFACQTIARSGEVDALVCVGVVIRGETTHYDLVAGECGAGIQSAQLDTKVPIGFGVLTVENVDQALRRSEPDGHNVGSEAAAVAVEMARITQKFTAK